MHSVSTKYVALAVIPPQFTIICPRAQCFWRVMTIDTLLRLLKIQWGHHCYVHVFTRLSLLQIKFLRYIYNFTNGLFLDIVALLSFPSICNESLEFHCNLKSPRIQTKQNSQVPTQLLLNFCTELHSYVLLIRHCSIFL